MKGKLSYSKIVLALLFLLFIPTNLYATEVAYTYDSLNRLTSAIYTEGEDTITLSYEYDKLGNITSYSVVNSADPESIPPDTQIIGGPSGTITYDDVTFTYTGTDNETPTGSLVYSYMLTGYDSAWSSYTTATQKSYPNLSNGSYTFSVRAKDQAGNVDSTPASRSFTVNVTPPDQDGDGVPDSEDAFPNDPTEWLDTDNDGTGNNADPDDDNDGMSDTWEEQYDGLDPLVNDASQDIDGDGFKNIDEYRVGTDPTDPESHPINPKPMPWIPLLLDD